MFSSIGLSFGLLIALFIPGFIAYLSIVLGVYDINVLSLQEVCTISSILKESYVLISSISVLIALSIGLLIDGVRYLLARCLQHFISEKIDMSKFDDADMKYHDWLVEHNFRFHQFYGNMGLGLLVPTWLLVRAGRSYSACVLIFVVAVCFSCAVLSLKKTLDSLSDRIRKKERA